MYNTGECIYLTIEKIFSNYKVCDGQSRWRTDGRMSRLKYALTPTSLLWYKYANCLYTPTNSLSSMGIIYTEHALTYYTKYTDYTSPNVR